MQDPHGDALRKQLELAQKLKDEDLYSVFLDDVTLADQSRSEMGLYLRPERMEKNYGTTIQKAIDLVFSRDGKPLPVGSRGDAEALFIRWTLEATSASDDLIRMNLDTLDQKNLTTPEQQELFRTLQDVYRLTQAQIWEQTSSHLTAVDREMQKYTSDTSRFFKGVRQFGTYGAMGLGAAMLLTPVGATAAGIGVGLAGARGIGYMLSRRRDRKNFEDQRKKAIQDYKGGKDRKAQFRVQVEEAIARERHTEVEQMRNRNPASLAIARDQYIASLGQNTENIDPAAADQFQDALNAESRRIQKSVSGYLSDNGDAVLEEWNRSRPEDQRTDRSNDSAVSDFSAELVGSMTRLFQVQESGAVMSGVIAQQHQRTPGRLERMTQLPERLRLQAHQSDTETFRIPFTEREVRFPSLFLSRDVPDRQQKDRRMRTVAALAVGGAFVATAGTWGLGAAVGGGAVAGVKRGRRIAGHY